MWHEARKHEKKIRGIMNDFYKRRSERRKQFYDIVKTDPMRFLQLHGTKCRIHYDGIDNEESQMMKWNNDILIDRFDVRAHLDHVPPVVKPDEDEKVDKESSELSYERYRVIIQNEFLGLSEEHFLNQLTLEEMFGVSAHEQRDEKSKKKNSQNGAAIGFNYGESSNPSNNVLFSQQILSIEAPKENRYDDFAKDLSDAEDSDADVDGVVDLNKLSSENKKELNSSGKRYGMLPEDFSKFLQRDDEQRQLSKQLKDQDNEKPATGKKFRRDRKMNREKKIFMKPSSPPSYAAVEEKKPEKNEESDQSSERSRSPSQEKITFITSFGGDEDDSAKKNGPNSRFNAKSRSSSFADVVRENSNRLKRVNKDERSRNRRRSYSSSEKSYSRDRRRSPDYRDRRRRYRRSRSSSRSRSRSPRRKRRSPSPRRPVSKHSPPRKNPPKNHSPMESAVQKLREQIKISKSNETPLPSVPEPIPTTSQNVPVKRYYGRRKSNESSSSMSANSEDENDKNQKISQHETTKSKHSADIKGKIGTSKSEISTGNSALEKQKKKLQNLLNKQYKADKRAENERKVREKIMQQEREEEMRELSLKMRKKQREKRHFFHDMNKRSSSDHTSESETEKKRRKRSSSSSSSSSSDSDHRYRR